VNPAVPRLRMFAGPNGSGKSVLKSYLPEKLLGVYLNPDEVEASMRRDGGLDLTTFGVTVISSEDVLAAFTGSSFLKAEGFGEAARRIRFESGRLVFDGVEPNSYFASVAVDFLRERLIGQRANFTFETVMSHPGKVDLLARAQQAGYRTYLYYVATEDPEINVSRVKNRIALGGHSVPTEKVVSRYHKSLDLLLEAIRNSNRAYIFDNSTDNSDRRHTWIAEVTDGRDLELKSDRIPSWFKRSVLDKIA